MRFSLVLVFMLAACASAPGDSVTAAPVIAAERAFAARGAEIGWVAAFREYTAPDGMVGNFENAPQSLAQTPDEGARNLFWWPAYAGIARSGDLGFTAGPFSVDEARTPRGQYFTVWRRQPDGSWKWIWDGGPGPISDPGPAFSETHEPRTMPVALAGAGAEEASRRVEFIERSFRNTTQVATYLADDAHAYRTGSPRGFGGMSLLGTVVSAGASDVSYTLRRIESSEAGDLVFTLGEARWTAEGEEQLGQYARIWQYRPEGWRIVYHQLVTPRRS